MGLNQPHRPIEDNAEPELSNGKVKTIHTRIEEIDEYAGERIKDVGDKVGGAVAICAVIFGFLIILRRSSNVGFVVGVLVLCVGLAASYVITAILHGYGESITKSIIDTKVRMRFEAKRAAELMEQLQAEQKAMEGENQATEVLLDELPEAADYTVGEMRGKAQVAAPDPKVKAAPLLGKVDPKIRHMAHFAERSRNGIICPICGRLQDSNRYRCFSCRANFIYDNEDAAAAFADEEDDDDDISEVDAES